VQVGRKALTERDSNHFRHAIRIQAANGLADSHKQRLAEYGVNVAQSRLPTPDRYNRRFLSACGWEAFIPCSSGCLSDDQNTAIKKSSADTLGFFPGLPHIPVTKFFNPAKGIKTTTMFRS